MTQASPAVRVVGIAIILVATLAFLSGAAPERLLSPTGWVYVWVGCIAILLVLLVVGITMRKFRGVP